MLPRSRKRTKEGHPRHTVCKISICRPICRRAWQNGSCSCGSNTRPVAPAGRIFRVQTARCADFRKHAKRPRLVYPKRDGLIYRLWFWLQRWKCCQCGKTFPHYPPGLLPYKRHLTEVILPLCGRYRHDERTTYRKVVKENGVPIVHAGAVATADAPEAAKEAERIPVLAFSTVWRWIVTLAGFWPKLRRRGEQRQQAAKRMDLSLWRVAPWKYRSEVRRQELIDSGLALELVRNTPDFATLGCGP